MRSTRTLSTIAIFTSLIIASDFALAGVLNVKLMDTLVFASAYAFGFRTGASIAVLSEFIWSVVTPYGFSLPIFPFLVIGELLYAVAGYLASRAWAAERPSALSSRNLFFGSILAICAFIWDFETNLATGLLEGMHTFTSLLAVEVFGIPFMIPHELSDFVLGATLAPMVIVACTRFKRVSPSKIVVVQSEVR